MVRHSPALGLRDLGGADVHAAVELHGVGVDDLAAEFQGELDGEVGLSGAGRPDDGDDGQAVLLGPCAPEVEACGSALFRDWRPQG